MLTPITIKDLENLAKDIQNAKSKLESEKDKESANYKRLENEYLALKQESEKVANILYPNANITKIQKEISLLVTNTRNLCS